MRRDRTGIAILGMLLLLAALAAGCGSSGKREGQIGTSETASVTVQKGDPELAAATGYAGSQACAVCHPNQFAGWGKSLHNAPLKTLAELGDGIFVNDADGNGVNDFKDGLNLESNPNFSAFGANAPELSFSNGKYFITIGTVSYEVKRTQGGNGLWKQRYHTKIGRSYYILPVQYNEKTREYVRYNTDHWYDNTNLPLFTGSYTDNNLAPQFGTLGSATNLGTQRSWENRCAGCHQTGLTAKAETTSYGGTNVEEVVTGYSELNIGCENCHGPGAQHASTGNPAFIINPQSFITIFGTVEGGRLANQVCGSCHHRGEGNAFLLSASNPNRLSLEYPARFVSGALQFPTPGRSVIDNSAGNPFVLLNTGTAYYGTAPSQFVNEVREIYSGYRNWYANYPRFRIYVASRQHHQQWTDIEQGPHAADTGGLTCWDCHDPHEGKGDHQVRNTVTVAGTTLTTNNDDNSLCLACHSADFGLSVNDVRIGGAKVKTAVLAHMGTEAVMGDSHIAGEYDPAGTGIGRCSKCHMPKTSSSAITTAFGIGLKDGDIHNHTFNTIWPSANVRLPFVAGADPAEMVNSCYSVGCHNNDPASALYIAEVDEWSKSGHADFTGEPFRHWDEDGEVSSSCAKCHSKPGFRDFAVDGIVSSAAKLGTKISCGACHTEEGDGTTLFDKPAAYPAIANVTFPSGAVQTLGDASNICMACHQGRESGVSIVNATPNTVVQTQVPDYASFDFINRHYFAAAAILFGSDVTAGFQYPSKTYAARNTFGGHSGIPLTTCADCHLRTSGGHTFRPAISDCIDCHEGITTFEDIGLPFGAANVDYDGDAVGESFQGEIDGLAGDGISIPKGVLLLAIESYASTTLGSPIVYSPGSYPYWFKDNGAGGGTAGDGIANGTEASFGNRYRDLDRKLLQAAFNFHSAQDPCGDIHNHKYVIQTLRDSIEDLTGSAPPGVRP